MTNLTDVVKGNTPFNTVADMKAATFLKVGDKVRTLGYHSVGDGGANDYEIVASGTGTDDGGSFISLTGTGYQAKGLFPDKWVRCQQFGAVSGDVTEALKNMFAADLHRYRIDDLDGTVSEDISLLSNTFVYAKNSKITPVGFSTVGYIFRNKDVDQAGYTGNSNIEIVGLEFDLNGTTNGAIGFAHAQNIKICGNRFTNAAGSLHFLDFPAVSNVIVECNEFDTCAATMCQIDQAATGSLPTINSPALLVDNTVSTNIRITSNRFLNGDNLGVHLHKDGHSDVIVTGNHFEEMKKGVGDDSGYSSGSSRVIISNNTYDSRNLDTGQFVVFYGANSQITVSDNVINLGSTNSCGVFLLGSDGNQSNVSVTGNTIVNAGSSAIVMQNVSRGTCSNNTVNGYGSLSGVRSGISIENATAVTVSANVVASPGASADRAINIDTCTDIAVTNNEITSGLIGINLNETTDFNVSSNVFNSVGVNIKQTKTGGAAENFSITGNVFKDPTDHCITLSNALYGTVSGNSARSIAATKDFINAQSSSAIVVNSNIMSGSSFRYAVLISGNGFNVINGNRIRGASDTIDVSDGSNSIITSNMISTYTNGIQGGTTAVISDNILV